MLKFDDVWFSYGDKLILRNINFSLESGEIVAILGPNGSGKTTLAKLSVGLLKPIKGFVYVKGLNTKSVSVPQIAKHIGIVFQNPNHQLFEKTVKDEILFALKNIIDIDEECEDKLNYWVEKLNLKHLLSRNPLTLSEGEKRRVALASVLVYEPDILVLDEPTTGQDKRCKEIIADIIIDYARNDKAVMVMTHDMNFAWKIASRFIILGNGSITFDGKPDDAINSDVLIKSSLKKPSLIKLKNILKELRLNIRNLSPA